MRQQVFNRFKRESKWLGIINYKFLIVSITYIFVIFNILKIFPISFKIQVYLFFLLISPIIGLFFVFLGNENAFEVLKNMVKYYISLKIYINKEDMKNFKPIIYK